MLKFNVNRSFFSIKERDEYCSEPDLKDVIYINPEHIVSVEKVKFNTGTFSSSYDITGITTLKGYFNVEGNVEQVSDRIADALR